MRGRGARKKVDIAKQVPSTSDKSDKSGADGSGGCFVPHAGWGSRGMWDMMGRHLWADQWWPANIF